jgi:hypothetical protein
MNQPLISPPEIFVNADEDLANAPGEYLDLRKMKYDPNYMPSSPRKYLYEQMEITAFTIGDVANSDGSDAGVDQADFDIALRGAPEYHARKEFQKAIMHPARLERIYKARTNGVDIALWGIIA